MKALAALTWFAFAILLEVAIHALGKGRYKELARRYGLTWLLTIAGMAAMAISVAMWLREY